MFFFKKKIGCGSVKKVYVEFHTFYYTTNQLDQGVTAWRKGNYVSFTSSHELLSENKNNLKRQISLYQIFTGSDYYFKTENILSKTNTDGSVIKYLRFELMDGGSYGSSKLYGYISQEDLSKEQEVYKMYLSTRNSDIKIENAYSIIQDNILVFNNNNIYIPFTHQDDIGRFCYIGISDENLLDYDELTSVVGNLSPSIEDPYSKDILWLKLYTNPQL